MERQIVKDGSLLYFHYVFKFLSKLISLEGLNFVLNIPIKLPLARFASWTQWRSEIILFSSGVQIFLNVSNNAVAYH